MIYAEQLEAEKENLRSLFYVAVAINPQESKATGIGDRLEAILNRIDNLFQKLEEQVS